MSIELKEAAEKALIVLESATSFMSRKARDQHESVVAELRTALQQAESEPVGEPRARVELIKTGGNAGLSTRIIELDIATRERLLPGDLLYTQPAPSVPADVVRDAERYRWILCNYLKFHLPDEAWKHGSLDAAMLEAKDSK